MQQHFQAIVTVLSLVNPLICGAMFAQIEAGRSKTIAHAGDLIRGQPGHDYRGHHLAVVHTKLLLPVTALIAVAVTTVVMWIMMVVVGREGTHAGNGFNA
jgi:hypothetical protein